MSRGGIHPKDAALLQQTIDKVRGMGVPVDGMHPRGSGLAALPWELVKITAFKAGGGLYEGTILRGFATDVDPTADTALEDLAGIVEATTGTGESATPETCVVANLTELALPGCHLIPPGRFVLGVILGNTHTLDAADTRDNKILVATSSGTDVTVKITGVESGGGKYAGVIWNAPRADILATGDLTDAECGSTGVSALIVNLRESGEATHDLSGSGTPTIFPGRLIYVNADSTPVVAIDGFQWIDCGS